MTDRSLGDIPELFRKPFEPFDDAEPDYDGVLLIIILLLSIS